LTNVDIVSKAEKTSWYSEKGGNLSSKWCREQDECRTEVTEEWENQCGSRKNAMLFC